MSSVGIDISIDPSGAVSGGRVATASLDQVEAAAVRADAATGTLREEMNALAAASRSTSQAQQQYLQSLASSTKAANQFTTATDNAGASMKQFRGFAGQAGFQISDIAIQLEAGANAATVFGIQGGQLLGALNPIAGALATIAGIAIGQFTGGMWGAQEATSELEKILKRTNKEINELSETRARIAQIDLTKKLNEDAQAVRELDVKIAVATQSIEEKVKRIRSISESGIIGRGLLLAAEGSVEDAEVELQGLLDQRTLLKESIADGSQVLDRYKSRVDGTKLSEEDLVRVERDRAKTIDEMNNNLKVLELRVVGNNREAAVQEAVFRSGAEAGSEYAKTVATLAGRQFDLEKQIRSSASALKEFDKDGEYLTGLQRQVEMVTLSARQQAILRAEYSLSADATDEQVAKAREYAAALYDLREAQRPADTSDRDFEASITGASLTLAAENESVFEQLQNQRDMILLYQEAGIGDAQAHADALVAIQRRTYQEQANIVSSGLGSILRLQQAWGDDSSGVYKTLLATQKAATLYSVLLSSYDAIGKAWASAPFPANLPAVATATVETGALGALVEAATPAFATGGYVHGAGTGTSDSIPARLSMGEFVMPARETSRYAPELNAMRAGTFDGGSGSVPKVTVVNQTTGRVDSASAQWVSRDELLLTLREEVPSIVAGEFTDPYSSTNRAMQQAYVTQRNL
jgi:hypothetical protein